MRFLIFALTMLVAQQAVAEAVYSSYRFPQVRQPVHKTQQMAELNVHTLKNDLAAIDRAVVKVYTEKGGAAPEAEWALSPRELVILLERLSLLADPITGQTEEHSAPRQYTSIELNFFRKDNQPMPRLAVFKNTAVVEGKNELWADPEGKLEKWLFSTAKTFEQRVFANQALNVQTFRDCQWAGNLVIEDNDPAQCIMPDGTLFLAVDDESVAADPKLVTYDQCYKAKRPILDEFPRKCVMPGGKVVVEPARIKETAPTAVAKPRPQPVRATPVAAPSPAVEPTPAPRSEAPTPVKPAAPEPAAVTEAPKPAPAPAAPAKTEKPKADATKVSDDKAKAPATPTVAVVAEKQKSSAPGAVETPAKTPAAPLPKVSTPEVTDEIQAVTPAGLD